MHLYLFLFSFSTLLLNMLAYSLETPHFSITASASIPSLKSFIIAAVFFGPSGRIGNSFPHNSCAIFVLPRLISYTLLALTPNILDISIGVISGSVANILMMFWYSLIVILLLMTITSLKKSFLFLYILIISRFCFFVKFAFLIDRKLRSLFNLKTIVVVIVAKDNNCKKEVRFIGTLRMATPHLGLPHPLSYI